MRLPFSILIGFLIISETSGQNDSTVNKTDTSRNEVYHLQRIKRDGVTMPEVEIKEVTVSARSKSARRSDYRKYERLVYNIKKVYPYALFLRSKVSRINEELKNITDEKERRKYIRSVEKKMFAEYAGDIQEMTISQGRLLIKLIDRETENTSYVLIRDYRGKFSAVFWQGIARIFGTNLKEKYDPSGEDALIEAIINEIDAGNL